MKQKLSAYKKEIFYMLRNENYDQINKNFNTIKQCL